MAKPKQTFTAPEDTAPEPAPPFMAAPEAAPLPPQPDEKGPNPLPKGFEPMDTAPQDGTTLKMWFGDDNYALARWRKTMKVVNHRWTKTGMWVHPGSNLPIQIEFKAWQPTAQVSQQDIDASNFAVAQENERRAKREAMRHPDKVSA